MERFRKILGRMLSGAAGPALGPGSGSRLDARRVLVVAGALPLLFAATCGVRDTETRREEPALGPEACLGLQERLLDKTSLTPAQKKIGSNLLLTLWAEQCEAAGHDVAPLRNRAVVDEEGIIVVDLRADVTAAVLAKIEELHGTVISSFADRQAIRAGLPILQLEELAESPDIRGIRAADEYQRHKPQASVAKQVEVPS